MRVLITTPWSERLGGAEAMLWTLLRHIDTDRFRPTVVFLEPGQFERDVAGLPGVETAVVPIGRLREPVHGARAIRRLAGLVRSRRPDVLLNWVAKAQLYGGVASVLAGRGQPVVWWQHGVPTGHWMDRAATAVPARAVGCSSTAAAAAQRALWPGRPTFVIHPGIEAEPGAPLDRTALAIPPGRVVLGIVGRLQPWKGQHRLLEAVAGLRDRGHDVHALVVGGDAYGLSPEYARGLDDLVRRLDLAERVTMTGHVADTAPYVAAMDVLVSASDREPFGIVLLEGMAQSRPVVAVADAGPTDIVEHGRTGLLVDRPDPAALTPALERLVEDRAERERFGAAGRARLAERFTAEHMTARFEAMLATVAAGGTPPTA